MEINRKAPASILFFLSITLALNAQTNTFPPSGNVGIGVVQPVMPLQVNGGIRWGELSQNYIYSGNDSQGGYFEQLGSSSMRSKMRLQSSRNGDASNYSQFVIDPEQGVLV